ncbi:MAG TPA: hypothetical protein VK658_06550, partial [Chryseolinea sp.]|nr:hypothetical protein [Chryseolinea sp.]
MTSEITGVEAKQRQKHLSGLEYLKNTQELSDHIFSDLVATVQSLQVAVPSWALGTGGTRFGRFPEG